MIRGGEETGLEERVGQWSAHEGSRFLVSPNHRLLARRAVPADDVLAKYVRTQVCTM